MSLRWVKSGKQFSWVYAEPKRPIEGPALTWFIRLPPLSIDSWRSLRDKFLLNFQGYRPDTDALAELSLCKQLEKETLREYYRKFLTLKSQLPSVDDQIDRKSVV